MMESLKYDFQFSTIDRNLENFNPASSLIWILHADKIPPHIGVSTNGYFFSLKVHGKDELMPITKLIALIQTKNISTLVIELNGFLTLEGLRDKYGQFDFANDLKSSCLVPIKELLIPEEKAVQLKELLEILEEKNQISRVFGLNLAETFKGIPHYTTEQIKNRLENLKHVER